jgi:hypothetical protein
MDQSSDFSGAEIRSFLKHASVPDYVLDAPVDDFDIRDALPKEAFADQGRKAFPINTAARTFVSNAYFTQKRAGLQKLYGTDYVKGVEDNIKQAAEILGIEKDIESYNTGFNEKQAADYSVKHVTSMDVEGQELELFPYKTAEDLSLAATQFATNTQSFPIEERYKIAEAFIKAAREIGLDELPDLIGKYAGMFYSTPQIIRQELKFRSGRLKTAESKDLYLGKLAKMAAELEDNDDVRAIASVCWYTEKNEGLWDNPKTASLLGDPVDKFFQLDMSKVASELDVVEAGGRMYRMEDLQKVSADLYKQAFGIDVDPTDKEKIADIFPTMPHSDITLFRELSGVTPV